MRKKHIANFFQRLLVIWLRAKWLYQGVFQAGTYCALSTWGYFRSGLNLNGLFETFLFWDLEKASFSKLAGFSPGKNSKGNFRPNFTGI